MLTILYVVRQERIWRIRTREGKSDEMYIGREVSVVFSDDILLKHGPPDLVESYFKDCLARIGPSGQAIMNLRMVTVPWHLGVEWLNQSIACSGTIRRHLATLVEQHGNHATHYHTHTDQTKGY